jgi:phage terminase small subunit
MARELNPKQLAFVAAYLELSNATKAAIKAGYPKNSAGQVGAKLLKNSKIRQKLSEHTLNTFTQAELKASDVISELRKLAFVDVASAYDKDGYLKPLKELPPELRASLHSLETEELFAGRGMMRRKIGVARKAKFHDKTRPLEILAKYFKLLTDKVEVSGTAGGEPIVVLTMPSNGREAPSEELAATEEEKPPSDDS